MQPKSKFTMLDLYEGRASLNEVLQDTISSWERVPFPLLEMAYERIKVLEKAIYYTIEGHPIQYYTRELLEEAYYSNEVNND